MRVVACCLLAFIPALSLADTVEFTFTGTIDDVPGVPNVWNGPGPVPSTFQMTFDVNTLDPANAVSYTFGPSSSGPSINSITASLSATDLNVSVDGKNVLQNADGGLSFSGSLLGPFSFIGGSFAAGDAANTVGFGGVPDFALGTTLQSQLVGSSDPLVLLLNGSSFGSDGGDITLFSYDGALLTSIVSGAGRVVSVPEPDTLALLALAAAGLGFTHRRRLRRDTLPA